MDKIFLSEVGLGRVGAKVRASTARPASIRGHSARKGLSARASACSLRSSQSGPKPPREGKMVGTG